MQPKKRSQPTLCSFIVFQKLCCSSETITNENPELRVPRQKLHLLSQVLEQNHPQSLLHLSWRDILSFFKFLQKKVYRLDKKLPAHFWIGVVICKNYVTKPLDSFKECMRLLFSSQETFFCRNLKNEKMSFLGKCDVKTASCKGI